MLCAKQLTTDEQGIILNMQENGQSMKQIGNGVDRVRGTVYILIENSHKLHVTPGLRRPRIVSEATFRRMIGSTQKGHFIARMRK